MPTAHYLADQGKVGWLEFGHAFGLGWHEYNRGQRGYMTSARDAYERWQESGGRRIFGHVSLIKQPAWPF